MIKWGYLFPEMVKAFPLFIHESWVTVGVVTNSALSPVALSVKKNLLLLFIYFPGRGATHSPTPHNLLPDSFCLHKVLSVIRVLGKIIFPSCYNSSDIFRTS